MAGTSRQTTWAPSRASTSAIAAPIPRAAPVTSATLPASGRSQSGVSATAPAPTAIDLAVDVRGAAGEQEAQRRLDAVLGAGRDAQQLAGGAAAQLLGGRADEALQRALGHRGARPARGVRRRAEDDQPAARTQRADVGVQERVRGAAGPRCARSPTRRRAARRPGPPRRRGRAPPARPPSPPPWPPSRRPTPRRRPRRARAPPPQRAARRARRRAAPGRPAPDRRARGGAAGPGPAGRAGGRRPGPGPESANCW